MEREKDSTNKVRIVLLAECLTRHSDVIRYSAEARDKILCVYPSTFHDVRFVNAL